MAPHRTALIVGAGIGGLAAAIALTRAGWKVRVFERAASPRELGFALLLAPNAMHALGVLGLADAARVAGVVTTSGEMRRPDGTVLRRFDTASTRALLDEDTTLVVSHWEFTGLGYLTTGDTALALSAAARARERRQAAQDAA